MATNASFTGTAYLQMLVAADSLIKILYKGDVIKCPPNVIHWHSACEKSGLSHVAVTDNKNGAPVWLEPVTDDTYHN